MKVFKNRVLESSSLTGTGNATLAGAALGFITFASALSVGQSFGYFIEAIDTDGNPTGAFENGTGTLLTGGLTFSRDTVETSSNANAKVDFAAGTKLIGVTLNAADIVTAEYVQAAPAYSPTSATTPAPWPMVASARPTATTTPASPWPGS